MYLMEHSNLTKEAAYDQARREFYYYRHLEDVERRIAKEEAFYTGAYFGKGALEVGMGLEDGAYENWKAWAAKQIEESKQARAQLYSGPVEQLEPELDEDEMDEALDEVQEAIPATEKGQDVLGGLPIHP
jgi:small subunit ribosomal protein S23